MKIGSKYLISGALVLLLVSLTLVGPVSAAMDSRPPPDRIINPETSVLPGTFDDHLGGAGFDGGISDAPSLINNMNKDVMPLKV